jgi:hypothetical protein
MPMSASIAANVRRCVPQAMSDLSTECLNGSTTARAPIVWHAITTVRSMPSTMAKSHANADNITLVTLPIDFWHGFCFLHVGTLKTTRYAKR